MRRLLLALVLAVVAAPTAEARGNYVWVLGATHSNVYHPYACPRVQKYRRYAEKMRLEDAQDLGLRRHTGCK